MSDLPPPIPVPSGSDGPPPIPTGDAAPPPIPTGEATPPAPPVTPAWAPGYGGVPAEMPAYGEAPPSQIANPGWRALAFLVDGVGTFALTTVLVFLGLFTGQFWSLYAIPVVPIASFLLATVLTATVGTTPGKALFRLRVVHVTTGKAIGAWSIIRSLVIVSPLLLTWFALTAASMVWDGRGWDVDSSLVGLAMYLMPVVLWIVLFVVVCVRPERRGVEDILARSIVVRSR